MNPQTIGTVLRFVGWAIFAIVVLYALVELVLSLVLPAPPVDRAPLVRVAPHPVLGYALEPSQKTFSYQAPVYTNAEGLRVPLLETSSSAGRVIVFIGGSETFGKGVRAEETYAKLVELEVKDARCVNAGVPDYNLDQAVLWLERYGDDHHPETVVLTFYWNDLFEEPAIDRHGAEDRPDAEWAPRTVLRETGLLRYVAPIYTRSRLAYVIRNWLKNVVGRYREYPEQTWRDALLDNRTFLELDAAWRRVDGELLRFAELAKKRGFRPVVLVLPIEHAVEAGRSDVGFAQDVRRIAEQHGLQVVDATDDLSNAVEPYIPWDGRPSVAGHQAIADALLRGLR